MKCFNYIFFSFLFVNLGFSNFDDKIYYCTNFNFLDNKIFYGDCRDDNKTLSNFYKVYTGDFDVRLVEAYLNFKLVEKHEFKYKNKKPFFYRRGLINYFNNNYYLIYDFFNLKNQKKSIATLSEKIKMHDGKIYRFFYNKKEICYGSDNNIIYIKYYDFDGQNGIMVDRMLVKVDYYDNKFSAYKVRKYKKNSIEEKYVSLNRRYFILYNTFNQPELSIMSNVNLSKSTVCLYYYNYYGLDSSLLLTESYEVNNKKFLLKPFKKLQFLNRQNLKRLKSLDKRQRLVSSFFDRSKYVNKMIKKRQFYYPEKNNENFIFGNEKIKKIEYYHNNIINSIINFDENGLISSKENFNLSGEKIFD